MAWCISASEIGTTINSVKMPSAACSVTAAASTTAPATTGPVFTMRAALNGVNERDDPDRIGEHAMIELHRERIFEEIPPQRHVEKQPRRIRHEGAVDQRPGVVDVAGAQAGDQRAEIDLRQAPEREVRSRRREFAPGAGVGGCSSSRCAVHRIAT